MKIAFAFNSYGLGHATRSLPLVKAVIANKHKVYIITSGRALDFLRVELGNSVTEYIELKDYSFDKAFTKKKFSSRRFFLLRGLFNKELAAETAGMQKLHSRIGFDVVVSDGRMGIYVPGVPSYLITNQIRVGTPELITRLFSEIYSEKYNLGHFKKFTKIIVPDTEEHSISGNLTHNLRFVPKNIIEYIGITSMLEKKTVKEDTDYFFSISGPEPQRTVFEHKVMDQLDKLQGKKVIITLGRPELADFVEKKGTITIYGVLPRQKQTEAMNRAKLVITRSGYSTVMDLAELEKKALYIPTDGQPEQEYLARFHLKEGNNYRARLKKLDLEKDLAKAMEYPGYKPTHKTETSVKNFLKLIGA